MVDRTQTDMDFDARLMAYADGALRGEDAMEMEAALERDPALRDRVALHRSLGDAVADAYAPVLDEPVPEHLKALVLNAQAAPVRTETAGERAVHRLWSRVEGFFGEPFRLELPQLGTMAACLVLGIVIAKPVWQSDGAQPLIADLTQGLSQSLVEALTDHPSGKYGAVEIGLTYEDKSGALCRAFHLRAEANRAGIACRQGRGWGLDLLVPVKAGPSEDGFRMAGSPLPAELIARIEERKQGEPLNHAQETQILEKNWRR